MATQNSLNINSTGQIAYNSSTGVFTASALTQHFVLVGGASNAITSVTPTTNVGWVLTSAGTSADPAFAPIPGTPSLTWSVVSAATKQIIVGEGYFSAFAGTLVYTLPATPVVGDTFAVVATASGDLWQVVENTGDTIIFGTLTTTATTGSLTATHQGDTVEAVCYIASGGGNTWIITDSAGSITIV